MQIGNFDEAKQVDFQEVSPHFDLMQHQVQIAIQAEGNWAQGVALRAKDELLAAATLAAIAILILFLRLQRQEHISQLEKTDATPSARAKSAFALSPNSQPTSFLSPIPLVKSSTPVLPFIQFSRFLQIVAETNMVDLLHPDDFAKTISTGPRSVAYGQNPIVEIRLRHADGTWLYFESVVRNLIQHKNIGGIVYNARDITERKHAQEQLLFNATHGVLTGLPNRALFLGRLQSVVDRMKRHSQEAAAVLFIDIDDFKVVNDCYGHATGDLLIKEVSKRLRASMRSDGTIARMGWR